MDKKSSPSLENRMWMVPDMVAVAVFCALVIAQNFLSNADFTENMNELFCMFGYFHATCYHIHYNHLENTVLIPLLVAPYLLGFISYFVALVLLSGISPKMRSSNAEPGHVSFAALILPCYMMFGFLYDFPVIRFFAGGYSQYKLIPVLTYGVVIIITANLLLLLQMRAHRS